MKRSEYISILKFDQCVDAKFLCCWKQDDGDGADVNDINDDSPFLNITAIHWDTILYVFTCE